MLYLTYVYIVLYSLFLLPEKVSKIKGRGGTRLSEFNPRRVPTVFAPKGLVSGEPK